MIVRKLTSYTYQMYYSFPVQNCEEIGLHGYVLRHFLALY